MTAQATMAGPTTARLFFDDVEPGTVLRSGPVRVTREATIAFASQYDPQPFHLDDEAGAASLLGGLAASGWHTVAIAMRLFYDAFVARAASMGSPGFDEVRWLRPVRPGDDLSLILTLGKKRPSATRPDRGFVQVRLDVRNGAGDSVMTQRGPIILQKRDAPQIGHPPPAIVAASAPTFLPAVDQNLTRFFEDVELGRTAVLGTQAFTEALIVDYARLFDPQCFHVDAEAAKCSHFGGLVASGWQTAAFWMKHYVAARERSGVVQAAEGRPVAVGGPSPGFNTMKWLRPVYPGQTVTYALETLSKRKAGRTGWGIVFTKNTGHAADGTLVFTFDGRMLWPMKPA